MRNILLLITGLALCAGPAFAANVASVTGDLPKDPASNPYFNVTIKVTDITNKGYQQAKSNGETYKDALQLYIGSGSAESDILSFEDTDDETVKFWVSQNSEPAEEQDSDEDWSITYDLRIHTKASHSGALSDAIGSDKTLTLAVEFFMGLKPETEDDYEQKTTRKEFKLTQAEYAADARPTFKTTAAVGTHKEVVVYYESPETINRTDGKSGAPSTIQVVVIPESLDATFQESGLPGKTYDADADSDPSITCTYQPTNTTSCVDCGTNGYVDTGSLDSRIRAVTGNVSVGEKTIGGLENAVSYRAFLQYDPTGIQQSRCVSAMPSETISYTELNGEDEAKPENIRCFIATAAYGSGISKHVALFRKFRDQVLMRTPLGQLFVGTYYRLSPPLAKTIAANPAMRIGARFLLSGPATMLAWWYDDDYGYEQPKPLEQ